MTAHVTAVWNPPRVTDESLERSKACRRGRGYPRCLGSSGSGLDDKARSSAFVYECMLYPRRFSGDDARFVAVHMPPNSLPAARG